MDGNNTMRNIPMAVNRQEQKTTEKKLSEGEKLRKAADDENNRASSRNDFSVARSKQQKANKNKAQRINANRNDTSLRDFKVTQPSRSQKFSKNSQKQRHSAKKNANTSGGRVNINIEGMDDKERLEFLEEMYRTKYVQVPANTNKPKKEQVQPQRKKSSAAAYAQGLRDRIRRVQTMDIQNVPGNRSCKRFYGAFKSAIRRSYSIICELGEENYYTTFLFLLRDLSKESTLIDFNRLKTYLESDWVPIFTIQDLILIFSQTSITNIADTYTLCSLQDRSSADKVLPIYMNTGVEKGIIGFTMGQCSDIERLIMESIGFTIFDEAIVITPVQVSEPVLGVATLPSNIGKYEQSSADLAKIYFDVMGMLDGGSSPELEYETKLDMFEKILKDSNKVVLMYDVKVGLKHRIIFNDFEVKVNDSTMLISINDQLKISRRTKGGNLWGLCDFAAGTEIINNSLIKTLDFVSVRSIQLFDEDTIDNFVKPQSPVVFNEPNKQIHIQYNSNLQRQEALDQLSLLLVLSHYFNGNDHTKVNISKEASVQLKVIANYLGVGRAYWFVKSRLKVAPEIVNQVNNFKEDYELYLLSKIDNKDVNWKKGLKEKIKNPERSSFETELIKRNDENVDKEVIAPKIIPPPTILERQTNESAIKAEEPPKTPDEEVNKQPDQLKVFNGFGFAKPREINDANKRARKEAETARFKKKINLPAEKIEPTAPPAVNNRNKVNMKSTQLINDAREHVRLAKKYAPTAMIVFDVLESEMGGFQKGITNEELSVKLKQVYNTLKTTFNTDLDGLLKFLGAGSDFDNVEEINFDKHDRLMNALSKLISAYGNIPPKQTAAREPTPEIEEIAPGEQNKVNTPASSPRTELQNDPIGKTMSDVFLPTKTPSAVVKCFKKRRTGQARRIEELIQSKALPDPSQPPAHFDDRFFKHVVESAVDGDLNAFDKMGMLYKPSSGFIPRTVPANIITTFKTIPHGNEVVVHDCLGSPYCGIVCLANAFRQNGDIKELTNFVIASVANTADPRKALQLVGRSDYLADRCMANNYNFHIFCRIDPEDNTSAIILNSSNIVGQGFRHVCLLYEQHRAFVLVLRRTMDLEGNIQDDPVVVADDLLDDLLINYNPDPEANADQAVYFARVFENKDQCTRILGQHSTYGRSMLMPVGHWSLLVPKYADGAQIDETWPTTISLKAWPLLDESVRDFKYPCWEIVRTAFLEHMREGSFLAEVVYEVHERLNDGSDYRPTQNRAERVIHRSDLVYVKFRRLHWVPRPRAHHWLLDHNMFNGLKVGILQDLVDGLQLEDLSVNSVILSDLINEKANVWVRSADMLEVSKASSASRSRNVQNGTNAKEMIDTNNLATAIIDSAAFHAGPRHNSRLRNQITGGATQYSTLSTRFATGDVMAFYCNQLGIVLRLDGSFGKGSNSNITNKIIKADFTYYAPKPVACSPLGCFDSDRGKLGIGPVPLSDPLSVLLSFAARSMSSIVVALEPKRLPHVYKQLDVLIESVPSLDIRNYESPIESFKRLYSGKKTQGYIESMIRSYEDYVSGFKTNRDFIENRYFTKKENCAKLIVDDNGVPTIVNKFRGIMVNSGVMLVHLCPLLEVLDNWNHGLMELLQIKHLSREETMDRIRSVNMGPHLATDYSSFESSTTFNMRQFETYVITKLLVRIQRLDLLSLYINFTNRARFLKAGGNIFRINSRCSGDFWTSVGNGITNLCILLYATQKDVVDLFGNAVFEGDDGLIRARLVNNSAVRGILSTGYKFSTNVSGTAPQDTDFLQAGYVDNKVFLNIPKMFKMLWIRSGLTLKRSKQLFLLRCQALSAYERSPGHPVITSLINYILRKTRGMTTFKTYMYYWDQYKPFPTKEVLSTERVAVDETMREGVALGYAGHPPISIADQLWLENEIDHDRLHIGSLLMRESIVDEYIESLKEPRFDVPACITQMQAWLAERIPVVKLNMKTTNHPIEIISDNGMVSQPHLTFKIDQAVEQVVANYSVIKEAASPNNYLEKLDTTDYYDTLIRSRPIGGDVYTHAI